MLRGDRADVNMHRTIVLLVVCLSLDVEIGDCRSPRSKIARLISADLPPLKKSFALREAACEDPRSLHKRGICQRIDSCRFRVERSDRHGEGGGTKFQSRENGAVSPLM